MYNSAPTEEISLQIVARFRVHDIELLGSVIIACERCSMFTTAGEVS